MSDRARYALFGALVVAALAVAAVSILSSAGSSGGSQQASSARAASALPDARAAHRPTVVYRIDRGKPTNSGQVAIAPLSDPGARVLTDLRCDRVYYAADRGICLAPGRGFAAAYQARVFGPDLEVQHTIPLQGVPSRARVSADGRLGAVTFFVAGHSYAAPGSFSTATTLLDLTRGRVIANLEKFVVFRGERRITAVDVNFWGITFARDDDTFYATVATGGKTFLIKGSIRAREAHVLHENVECPSLSPDGTRIAYKKHVADGADPWRLYVLDLATMRETALAEPRSVDDQAEWLDDGTVTYGVDGAVWRVPADGSGAPARLVAQAGSPAVVRW